MAWNLPHLSTIATVFVRTQARQKHWLQAIVV
jgi:hypothetical protein